MSPSDRASALCIGQRLWFHFSQLHIHIFLTILTSFQMSKDSNSQIGSLIRSSVISPAMHTYSHGHWTSNCNYSKDSSSH